MLKSDALPSKKDNSMQSSTRRESEVQIQLNAFKTSLDLINQFAWQFDSEFNFLFFNKPLADFLQTNDNSLLINSVDIKSLNSLKTTIYNAVKENKTIVNNVSICFTNDLEQIKNITCNLQLLYNNNAYIGTIGIAHAAAQSQHDQQSEAKFQTIFEQSNSAISIQTDTEILMVNKAWESITGYSKEEALSINPLDIIHPQSKEAVKKIEEDQKQGISTPENYLLQIISKDQSEKWVNISASNIEYEGKLCRLIIGSDITESKRAEIEINKLSTGIMNSPLSIVITDIDGVIEYVNPFFCESTGYSKEEALGQNPSILQSGKTDPAIYNTLWSTILKGEVWHGEFINKKKNDDTYWERARIAPIFNENNIITNFIAIKEDVTEQKRYQEMIEQSAKDLRDLNAKKDKFFSIIAHDLRSPFVGLVGLTDLLNNNFDELSKEKVTHYLKYANEAAHSVFRLLETLLEWSKSQTGKMDFNPEKIELSELIQDSMGLASLSAKNKNITLVNFAFKSQLIIADKNMVFTILRNLISNAIKYTPQDGKITIDTKLESKKIIISVQDTGVGIPKEQQNKLFKIEENYTTMGTNKEKGSGLGLLLCKEFVEKHGGEIWCKSEKDEGSTFLFSLPVRI